MSFYETMTAEKTTALYLLHLRQPPMCPAVFLGHWWTCQSVSGLEVPEKALETGDFRPLWWLGNWSEKKFEFFLVLYLFGSTIHLVRKKPGLFAKTEIPLTPPYWRPL